MIFHLTASSLIISGMMCYRMELCRFSTVGSLFFFFFQAEDGIRDKLVTGVQTCALPIFLVADGVDHAVCPERLAVLAHPQAFRLEAPDRRRGLQRARRQSGFAVGLGEELRSEERRVGKECRSRWSSY